MANPTSSDQVVGSYSTALGELRGAMQSFLNDVEAPQSIKARAEVLARYGPVFSSEHIESLDAEEFRSFLYIENNRHWSGLYRRGLEASKDMPLLIQGLQLLLDESRPLATRYSRAVDMIPGMGKGLATAVLTVAYPNKYGVWNNTSEAALRHLGIWPRFAHGDGPGGKYAKVNELLTRLAHDLEQDPWTLDSLLWFVVNKAERRDAVGDGPSEPGPPLTTSSDRFALERQLEEFMVENWFRTPLGRDWKIHEGEGDSEVGQQFPTEIGRIDILAHHQREPRWLVIELKRGQTGDQTVGQVLRYMGWVKSKLAAPSETVEGLIIAHAAEPGIKYAITAVPNGNCSGPGVARTGKMGIMAVWC